MKMRTVIFTLAAFLGTTILMPTAALAVKTGGVTVGGLPQDWRLPPASPGSMTMQIDDRARVGNIVTSSVQGSASSNVTANPRTHVWFLGMDLTKGDLTVTYTLRVAKQLDAMGRPAGGYDESCTCSFTVDNATGKSDVNGPLCGSVDRRDSGLGLYINLNPGACPKTQRQ